MKNNLRKEKIEIFKCIGRELHILRTKKGVKQVTVAAELNIPQSMLSEIEQGKRHSLTLDIIIELSHYYGEQWYKIVQRCVADEPEK